MTKSFYIQNMKDEDIQAFFLICEILNVEVHPNFKKVQKMLGNTSVLYRADLSASAGRTKGIFNPERFKYPFNNFKEFHEKVIDNGFKLD